MGNGVDLGAASTDDRIRLPATIGHSILEIDFSDPSEQIVFAQTGLFAEQLPHGFDHEEEAIHSIVDLFLSQVVVHVGHVLSVGRGQPVFRASTMIGGR